MTDPLENLIAENDRRNQRMFAPFNPVTGKGSVGERFLLHLPDFPIPDQWLPLSMQPVPLVDMLASAGSVAKFIETNTPDADPDEARARIILHFTRLRCLHDFPFWAATYVYIKDKEPGRPDCLFRLTYPQRRFVEKLEQLRLANKPIRIILLKARQWGGSTTSQIYMAWLQLVHRTGLNSLIIAHINSGSEKIKAMFRKMLDAYPLDLLYPPGAPFNPSEPKLIGEGTSRTSQRIPQRNTVISVGSAQASDSCRGGDYALVHLSEVGLWCATEGRKPEDIVRSACSGVLYRPYTMIVYESTANGVGNFFHSEYTAAKDPKIKSQFEAMFVSWFDIELYRIPFASEEKRRAFAENLLKIRNGAAPPSNREEPGRYLWYLWQCGASLEGINWYVEERAKYTDHGQMAAEYPSDDNEAFVNSGNRVFDKYLVDRFRPSCRPPAFVGDVSGKALTGPDALADLRFDSDSQGLLQIWSLPENANTPTGTCSLSPANSPLPHLQSFPVPGNSVAESNPEPAEEISNRYLTVVDIGGRTSSADWSVICVFDRLPLLGARGPQVVAQWYGHTDIDLLAWKAAQISAFYDNALLVIESNTIETHDRERHIEGGDQSLFILNQIREAYPNLYARRQSADEIRQGLPRKYGFHTNTATKPMIISNLVRVIREKSYTERDSRCLDEFIDYERRPNGSYGAIVGRHDDLLMTRAIGLYVSANEMEMPAIVEPSQGINARISKLTRSHLI